MYLPANKFMRVVLPAPLGPTIATREPMSTPMFSPLNAKSSRPGYLHRMLNRSKQNRPAPGTCTKCSTAQRKVVPPRVPAQNDQPLNAKWISCS